MELQPLKASKRELSTKSAIKNLRKAGKAPAVFYGNGVETLSLEVDVTDFRKVYGPGRRNTLLNLDVDGTSIPAIVYGLQQHAITRDVMHIDFKAIKAGEAVAINIPLHFSGDAIGVKNEGGMLVKLVKFIRVTCLPEQIPESFDIDLTPFPSGHTFYAQDFELPEGVKLVSSPRTVIFAIQKGRGKK